MRKPNVRGPQFFN